MKLAMLKSRGYYILNRILIITFFSLFSSLASLAPVDTTAGESITSEQENLLKNLPSDQAAAIRLKIMDQQALTSDIRKAFEEVNTLVLRPEKKILTGKERIDYEKKSKNWVFGYELFAAAPTTFAASTDIPIPNDYLVGPGDELQITIIGGSRATSGAIANLNSKFIVDRSFSISLPSLGRITLAGLTFKESREHINKIVKNKFVGLEAIVSLADLRTIKVFVMGAAYMPGAYSVSSLASITNVLHITGGVSEIGSVRNIQIKRQGKEVLTFDLYDLLLKGDTSKDIIVKNGDVIFIPTISKSVRMHGAFKRPSLFEIKEGDKLYDLVGFAGGLASDAQPNLSEINRVNKNLGLREITKINLNLEENLNQKLTDGDMIFVPSITGLSQSTVALSGQFKYPGKYSVKNGEKLSSLLKRAGGFSDNAFLYGTVLTRRSVSEMQNASFRRAADDMETAIAGAIIGGQVQGGAVAAVSDLLNRLRTTQSPGRLIVDIDPIHLASNPARDIYLEDGDTITIPSRINSVTVVGDVYSPGTIPFENLSKLEDYIAKAGGLRPSADKGEIFMILPNGEARAIQSGIWRLKKQFISPGSTIYIPRDTKPFDWLIATQTFTPILSNLATTAAALAAINN